MSPDSTSCSFPLVLSLKRVDTVLCAFSTYVGRQLFESKRMKNDSEKSLTTAADVFVDTSVFEGLDLGDLGDLDLEDAEGGAAASD